MNRGFSLVELSISVVIIAFIVAGISAGSGLVERSKINRIIAQNQEIESAYNAFKITHNAIAGDFKYAFATFGSASCTNASVHSDVNGCNGDGNNNFSGATNREGMLFWKHLAAAGLINGQYSVIASGTWIPGANAYKGILDNSGYYVNYDSYYNITEQQNMFNLGAPVTNGDLYGAALTPLQAYSIDIKSDDGHPAKGRVLSGTAIIGASGTCINGSGFEDLTSATQYTPSNDAVACRMVYKFQ
jgi:prepilin-type N-terminal cleavage/methylation domain-containing protein